MSDAAYVKELQNYVDRLLIHKKRSNNKEKIAVLDKKIRSTQCVIDLYEKMGVTPTNKKLN